MERRTLTDREFAANWARSQRALGAFVMASLPRFHEAEDVVQRVAMTAFEIRDRYDPESSTFTTWVIGIARNEILHWYRDQQRCRVVFDADLLASLSDAAAEFADKHVEIAEALVECMEGLNDRGKEMLRLKYYKSARSKDIAVKFATTPNVVDKTISRVRKQLLRCISQKTQIDEVAP
ncbi:sigma-70 family RNA polymerase sigma factor [Planctomycetales bacterium ZRK34]|nr:sigma-70 family RNA polymerase sigma factor [Planctomycetales bacterium ZRK34]